MFFAAAVGGRIHGKEQTQTDAENSSEATGPRRPIPDSCRCDQNHMHDRIERSFPSGLRAYPHVPSGGNYGESLGGDMASTCRKLAYGGCKDANSPPGR
jgi:hypothetical protein